MKIFQRIKMRGIALLPVFCLLMMTSTFVSAQSHRVNIVQDEMTLAELFAQIKRQTGTTIVFDAGNVPPGNMVMLEAGDYSVVELLNKVLPKSQYAWRRIGTYIVVRTIFRSSAADEVVPQPTQREFERDVAEYSRRNLAEETADSLVMRYDTIRTVKLHDGVFRYAEKEFTPVVTNTKTETPFERTTPPMLALKTNLAWWAARGTLNIGTEIGLTKNMTLEIFTGLNRWNLKGSLDNNKKMAHWLTKAEVRYWLCERFNGHFFGVHAFYGQYNVGGVGVPLLFDKKYRYEGDGYGGGVNYGYHMPLSKRWGAELTLGLGVAQLNYTKSDCLKCGPEIGKENKLYVGPTELGLKVMFMLR
jgi:hypothetical protein